MLNNKIIAILGAGNMGSSLLGGLIATGVQPTQIWVTDPDQSKLDHLEEEWKINTTHHNSKAVKQADVVILAVKPQIIETVSVKIAPHLSDKQCIISIAAGIQEQQLKNWLGENKAIIRCMPNTPALVRCGATAMHANENVSETQKELAESILRAVGTVVWLDDEKQMDAVTALSGSGPAYFFLVMEALLEAGKTLGLSDDLARLLTLQTALGAARMAMESNETVIDLRQKVTSKGGTTEAAIHILESEKLREIFLKALTAAKMRSEELAKQS